MASIPTDPSNPQFEAAKTAVLNIVKARKCTSVPYLARTFTSFAAMIPLILEHSITFDCDTSNYLETLLEAIDDSDRVAQGVYYNKTGTTITNPKMLVKCTFSEVIINTGNLFDSLMITRSSTIQKVTIDNGTEVNMLTVAGNSELGLLATKNGGRASVVLVRKCGDNISRLLKVTAGAAIDNIAVDEGAIFNGEECLPITVLDTEISNLRSREIETGFQLLWVNPSLGAGVLIYYRKTGESEWQEPEYELNTDYTNALITTGMDTNVEYEFLVKSTNADGSPTNGQTITGMINNYSIE